MMRKQILTVREHSRTKLLEREKTEIFEQTLTFNITYYPVFKDIRNILQELHFLLAPDKEHKRVFPNVPVVGFCIGKSLKDNLVRAALPKTRNIWEENLFRLYKIIRTTTTFTTEACGKLLKFTVHL